MKVEIFRIDYSPEGVYGVMLMDGKPFCCTLELPDKENRKRQSCIPTGTYQCIRYSSPKLKNTFEVMHVLNRDKILFHAGNTMEDTQGCILLGETQGKLQGQRAILNSGNTFNLFLVKTKGLAQFNLLISNTILPYIELPKKDVA